MILQCFGSSSSGNGYALTDSKGFTLLIEAGVPYAEVKKHVDPRSIVGCLVSHSHGDHGGRVKEYLSNGIKILTDKESFVDKTDFGYMLIDAGDEREIHDFATFLVKSFPLKHDVPCYGFIIKHNESGMFPFITDTHYCPFIIPNMDNIMIECNYDHGILQRNIDNGSLPEFMYNRIAYSHISLDTCLNFLSNNDLSNVNNIVLLHLSDGNSDAEYFKRRVVQATGKMVHIADKNFSINFLKDF